MLSNILFKNQSKSQLIIAVIGAFLGFTFLISSLHYLIRVNQFGEGEDILGTNTIIVQKKITNYNSLALAKTDFSENEILKLREKGYIEKVEPILNNSFDVSFATNSDLVPYFRTDVFVQTLDPEFVDMDTNTWRWDEKSDFIPIILPRDFIVMLNTFASAKGLPQVSDELAKEIDFTFNVVTPNRVKKYPVKIIGFTSEVSSILIPTQFMEYGNRKYPSAVPAKVTQLMVSVKEGEFGSFQKYMSSHYLESKKSSLVVGKLKSIAGTMFSIVLFVSVLTVLLSILVLIQYAQLILSKNDYEIRTLLRIGQSPKDIIKAFSKYFYIVFSIIVLSSIVVFALAKFAIDALLEKGGIFVDTAFTWQSILVVLLLFVGYALLNHWNAKRTILKTR